MARPREDEEARFWRYVEFDTNGGCWLWTGGLIEGYAKFNVLPTDEHEAYQRGARWAYEHFIGPIPAGLTIDHLCRVRCCVNPWHFEPVTPFVNTMRGEAPSAINRRKMVCVRGHPLSGDNVHVPPSGRRHCLACRYVRGSERRERQWRERTPAPVPTHCRHGHPWATNFQYNHKGRQVCATCQRLAKAAYKAKMRENRFVCEAA